MNIGIVCYASVGGSGVVATELAHALALRGHRVHLISSDLPFRWRSGIPDLSFERVETPTYPLFREPQYLLALTNTIVRVARRRRLDIVHAHYAVPHATAAYLADQVLSGTTGGQQGESLPRTVTTLHGTDITLVGSDPSYAQVVAFSIEQSHGVTAVSQSLKQDTARALGVQKDIRVIPNFLDCGSYRRVPEAALRRRFCPDAGGETLVLHVSNFRAVKRVSVVFDIFKRMREHVRARLVMIGDGPDRADLERQVGGGRIHRRRWTSSASSRIWCPGSRPPTCSCCPRRRRASAWRRSKRWRAKCRSSPRASAACRRSSRTA